MTRATFNFVLTIIGPMLAKKQNQNLVTSGRDTIDPTKQFLLALWLFCTPDSYRSICDRFDVGKATLVRSARRVTAALLQIRSQFIMWPENNEVNHINNMFEATARFPKVIGAVDGTHIRIAAPTNNPEAYINRKNVHSIQLQVVCDNTRKFIHCYVGYPGSVHDQRIFRLSGLQEICNNPEKFPHDSHLIGDSAYMIQRHLMVPYRDTGRLNFIQRNFNTSLSSTRMVVERSLALLKGRFRRLLDKLPMTRTDLIPQHIMACCVLHNICLLRNDLIDIPIIIERQVHERLAYEPINAHFRMLGIEKRNTIAQNLALNNII